MAPRARRSSAGASSRSPSPAADAPTPESSFEFGGPVGACITMLALPCVIVGLYAACTGVGAEQAAAAEPAGTQGGCVAVTDVHGFLAALRAALSSGDELLSPWALKVVVSWILFQACLERLLPGEVAEGVRLADGSRLRYRLNGLLGFWASMAVLCHAYPQDIQSDTTMPHWMRLGAFPLAVLYDEYLQLAIAAIAISSALAVYLYVSSFGAPQHDGVARLLAPGGQSGWKLYDFFMGRELNPRLGGTDGFDLKVFCELRPGLIGWVVLNLGMAAKQVELYGAVSPEMVSVNVFQALYVIDALYNERAILTTMDITTDGFGFMLAFGDLAWVPFTYSLQARFLTHNHPELGRSHLAAIWILNFCGYALFRLSNSEKDTFRRDPTHPSVAHLSSLQTKRGTKLLTSGYWGMARKINYTGDWMMGLSWCLTCGFDSIVPYFYAIYFGILLVHRAWRDDEACHKKYGADWLKYKAAVPYVFFPGLI